ncbi:MULTISPECIES: ATP-binding protein [unclassified Nodularia (in: cyanobacteria)]|uniref:ATP-binding protein n=1 Tax=unclassified Nodularia (in: cyanobacteria) TaxID=2656917 RepID=UPI0018800C0E|nr:MULTISPECIES: ATP-binding protein [unclassified Nodularia (in: cyanobacteria)]MBE9200527.1 ATP-binding protein [Nodularia sp. LEGE 06071]MCC2691411.1 ATP-binding protein [Nodularia sp. LEGE 04288]
MTQDFAILKRIYNSFDPFRPLPAGDPAYVDCSEVRGDGDILVEVGREILLSDRMTSQLYAGHRGAGKSTELLRLQKYLDENGCFVVYFAADEEDIDPEDAQYTDILLACTRHLLRALKDNASPDSLLNWLNDRWQDLKDLALTEVSLDSLSIEAQISQFAKITANLKTEPSQRQKIREKVNPHTITLIKALNQFIRDAKKNLPPGYSQLVLIADNLDRIVPIPQEGGRSNHEQIFIDRSGQLQELDCHLIYTVPISLLYSNHATNVADIYGKTQVLPMIMVQTPENQKYDRGINKVTELLQKRLSLIDPNLSIVDIFEERQALEAICLMSGGHVRNLLLLMKEAMKYTNKLPIPTKAVKRSISELRNTYSNTVFANEWEALATVHHSKEKQNDQLYRGLLFNRCILEYRYIDKNEESRVWYDIHPLLKGVKEFKDAFNKLYP